MADNNISTCARPIIELLPEELILMIFSYIPLPHLKSSVPYVCKRWARLSNTITSKTCIKFALEYDERRTKLDQFRDVFDKMRLNHNLRYVKITSVDLFSECTLLKDVYYRNNRARELFRELMRTENNIHYLCLDDWDPYMFIYPLYLVYEHPTIKTVTFISRIEGNPESVNVYIKFVDGTRKVEIYFQNLYHPNLKSIVPIWVSESKHTVEAFEISHFNSLNALIKVDKVV